MAKARVKPLKRSWNIQRLELVAAVVGVRLHEKIAKALEVPIDSSYFHCDNASVLGWVRGDGDRQKAFISNRVKILHAGSVRENWRYVPSESNPADILSRGKPLSSPEHRQFWVREPPWPSKVELMNFEHVLKNKSSEAFSEEEETISFTAFVSQPSKFLRAERFSQWARFVRVTSYVVRGLNRFRKLSSFETPHVSPEEFAETIKFIFREVQRTHFGDEIRNGLNKIHKSSALFQLSPFRDDNGLIRCRSRLERASEWSFDQKYPIILPYSDPTVELYVNWIHAVKCVHSGGVNAVLHHLRTRVFVLKARRVVKKIVARCAVCAKFRAKRASEVTPPLPDFRTEVGTAFQTVGCDFAGPIFVRNDAGERSKSYICLFVCATTRAVHLELVPDLTCYEFLLSLRRFFNRFPFVSKIISDNALTFKRAEKELALIRAHIRSKDVQADLARFDISWEFAVERSPWQNGWVERLVQCTKRPLRKVLGTNVPKFRDLSTTLTDIEAMINSRPLTYVSTDPQEVIALSPQDLVFGCRTKILLPNTSSQPLSAADSGAVIFQQRWHRQQAILNAFWRRFVKEYLQYLRNLHYSKPVESRPLKVGDLCLLEDPSPSRAHWPLCRVTSLVGGQRTDLRQRSCFVKFADGRVLRRSIQNLFPLEV